MFQNNKKIQVGMLCLLSDFWCFKYGRYSAETFNPHNSLFEVVYKLAELGWEPVFSDKDQYFFKRVG